MTITLTPEESEKIFFDALCNIEGNNYFHGYGIELQYDRHKYQEAKAKLKQQNPKNGIGYEDILMQMLKDGAELQYIDLEGDTHSDIITLPLIHERVSKAPAHAITEMIDEVDDVVTADIIIQTVFYNEVIFS